MDKGDDDTVKIRRNAIRFGFKCVCLLEIKTTGLTMRPKTTPQTELKLQDVTPPPKEPSPPSQKASSPTKTDSPPACETCKWKSGAWKQEYRQFLVMMWKHFTVRKRRFIITITELISPCFFFVIIFLIKTYILDADVNPKESKLMSDEVPIEYALAPDLVLYSPATSLTDELMDAAGAKMDLKRLLKFPVRGSNGFYGITEESVLRVNDLVKNMRDDTAFVIFQNMDDKYWPKKLFYTIRMKKGFDMEKSEEENDNKPYLGVMDEQFMHLQWAIDSSYIALRTESQRRQMPHLPAVALAEFPPPDMRGQVLLISYCSMLNSFCPLSLMLPFIFLLNRLIDERTSGVKELVKQVGVSYDTWAHSHGFNTVMTGLVYSICGTVICKVSNRPILPNTNGFLLFLMFELHFHTIMMFAFICSFLTKSGEFATTLAVVSYVIICIPARLLERVKLSQPIRYLSGLLPHVPQSWFWSEAAKLEIKGPGIRFNNMSTSNSPYSQSVFLAYIMMIMQIFIYFHLAAFFDDVCPSKYGTKKSWNIFKRRDNIAAVALNEVLEEQIPKDPKYFEASQGTKVGIQIDHVTKIFGKKVALANVSFEVYRGEITILLGHNGAGKTTLMSIITGMLSQTAGKVFVNGIDIAKEKTKVQTVIGLCPQHNLFFPNLSVMEHVRFFAMLKGDGCKESYKTSKELLEKLGIENKSNSSADELSGGMKRRLQLACALSGGSNVLILDEPTSGLDVETRRELWNLFLSLRGERTMVLSTHFMEEADALGDRIVALHAGRLRCHASPMFLKKNIGTGYRLSLTTTGLPQEQKITALVTSVIPAATLKESSYNSVSYNLPSQHSDKFPKLFAKLEARRAKLGIQSIGVGVSSLEEVFLKLCSDVDTKFTDESVDIQMPEAQYSKITGCILYLRQMAVLFRRQIRYLMFKKYSFIILQVLLPIGAILFWTYNMRKQFEEKNSNRELSDISLNGGYDKKTALVRIDSSKAMEAIERISSDYENVEFQITNNVAKNVLRASQNENSKDVNASDYKKYVVGIELNNTNAKVMYTTIVRHAASAALNLLSNILAAENFPENEGKNILTRSQPFSNNYEPLDGIKFPLKLPKTLMNCGSWVCVVVIIVATSLINAVSLPTLEREAGTRHIHLMSGCPPVVHWLTTFLTHILLYSVLLLVPTTLFSLIDREETFDNGKFMGCFFLVLLLGSMAFLFICYLFSFSFSKSGSGLILTNLIVVFGLIPAAVYFSALVSNTDLGKWIFLCLIPCYLFPPATTVLAALKTAYVARVNALCDLNLENCVVLRLVFGRSPPVAENKVYKKGCMCTLCINEFAPGIDLIILATQIVVYGTFVIMAQYGIFNGLKDRIYNIRYKPQPNRLHDYNVDAEKYYVTEQMKQSPHDLIQKIDAMMIDNLHKQYFKYCKKNVVPVKGISFSVKKGECFGLLGVNGAGKSTTFKMITAEEVATRGHIYANGHVLKWPRSTKYIQTLGYCPQFFGLDDFLSGRENLATLLTMQGLETDDIIMETNTWIDVVGLERYSDILVNGYSGGCMRRLATAAALSSGAPLTLLDEPTSGVDVSARRRVWLALRWGLRQNRAVIITSHSMDEMEALCDRIAIMSAGEIAALGSAPALRAAHAAGHALMIKLKVAAWTIEKVQKLKAFLNEEFNCTLNDEHSSLLHYHINETMQYSSLFSKLEHMKKQFSDLIEDYSVTETTLEEVFLSFAHETSTEAAVEHR